MSQRFYQCTCFERCKGGREVSRSTYQRHRSIRVREEQLNPPAQFAVHASSSHAVVGDSIVGGNDDSSDSEEEASEDLEGDSRMEIEPEVDRGSNRSMALSLSLESVADVDHLAMDQDTGQLEGPNQGHDQVVDPLGDEDTTYHEPILDPGCQDLDDIQSRDAGGNDGDEEDDQVHEDDEDDLEPGMADTQAGGLDVDQPPRFSAVGDAAGDFHKNALENLAKQARLSHLNIAMEFAQAIEAASLDDDFSKLDPRILDSLRNPPTTIPDINATPGLRLGIDIFLALTNAAQETYTSIRKAILKSYPNDEIPSYDQIKQHIAEMTGVFAIVNDMCINSCLAYTGPYEGKDACPECGESCYDPVTKKSRQIFQTIPIGPLLQVLKLDEQSATNLNYRHILQLEINKDLSEGGLPFYKDFMHGEASNNAINAGHIKEDDFMLMMSFDGAQLFANKVSDCWIYIWVIFDRAPDGRYLKKCVLPGGFIPGPNKPKNPDSYLFPGLHHLSALQKEGISMWDARKQKNVTSHPFLCLATADGPGMAYLNGLVGHHGKNGCRLFCTVPGRHKQGGTHYYPALLKPVDYDVEGSDHPDIDVYQLPVYSVMDYEEKLEYVIQSRSETQYKKRRLETGISKPSIFMGLNPKHRLDIPGCFGSDIMHLGSLNIPDLLINLWRGAFECDRRDDKSTWDWAVLQGPVWEKHGKDVAACTPYLPGSFDRPPRNPAEKISSGYKAWEFLMYLYSLGPGLFYNVLPKKYWKHFCKLVYGMRIMNQHHIRTEDLKSAHLALLEFVSEFEMFYYQRRSERLHFVRQSIHALTHLAPEAVRLGPPICSSQWTMERTIGNLVEEIRQPSNPYANLSQRGLQRCQVNTLKSMFPSLEEEKSKIPRGALDLGSGYVLLRARDRFLYKLSGHELAAVKRADIQLEYPIQEYLSVYRWARLRLPNGQIARSAWKESLKPLTKVRMTRNVKVCTYFVHYPQLLILEIFKIIAANQTIEFAEVLFYFQLHIVAGGINANETFALVSKYSPPHTEILEESYHTFWSCTHGEIENMEIIPVKSILAVVAMIPHNLTSNDPKQQYFLSEKPGLEVACLAGVEESMDE